jgi:hypothetical protein
MNRMRTYGLMVLALSVSGTPAVAGVLQPTKASQLVTLLNGPPSGGCYPMTSRVQSDGTLVPFTIPLKQVLIVTSGRILVSGNANLTYFLSFTVGGNVLASRTVDTDAEGFADATVSIPNGFAVSSGTTICLSATPASTPNAELHGFLAPDK